MIGRTLGHYKIVSKLGAGAMGEVYLAEDRKLGRKVALKVPPAGMAADPERLSRYEREARAVAALNHPNIVTLHSIEEWEGVHFLTMELVEGRNLAQLLPSGGFELERLFELAIPIADALAAAHAAGVTHRDLKPENIMVSEAGQVKILDFGLAKLRQSGPEGQEAEQLTRTLTQEGMVMGTVPYMSPEQVQGKPIDHRSDIFSLGVILYEMSTGKRPFLGETAAHIISSIMRDQPRPVTEEKAEFPNHLARVIRHCLEKDPQKRYQSALDVRNELGGLREEVESGAVPAAGAVAPSGGVAAAAPSQAVPAPSSGAVAAPPSEAAPAQRPALAKRWIGLAAVLLLLAGVAVFTLRGRDRGQALTESDYLLLTDFVNTTGDPVFDDTLTQALAVKLEESPFLNVYPEEKVRETLQFMQREPDERVSRAIGREICLRRGVKAMLTGEIVPLGSSFVVTLNAVDCRSGDSLARRQAQAGSKEEVLGALGETVSAMRRDLGESLASLERYDAPIEQATTSSLEALKAYSLGGRERALKGDAAALPFLRRAVDLDPNFALAHAYLGTIYSNLGENDLAIRHRSKAFEFRDRVSELERLYITAHYYNGVVGNTAKAIETYELWEQTYPRDWTPSNNLAVQYQADGELEKAAEAGRRALELQPDHVFPYGNLAFTYLSLGRADEARLVLEHAWERGLDDFGLHLTAYNLAVIENDAEAMREHSRWSEGKPEEVFQLSFEMWGAANRGRYREALELHRRVLEAARRFDFSEAGAIATANLAGAAADLGLLPEARRLARQALAVSRGRGVAVLAAPPLALAGEAGEAEALIGELAETFPEDTSIHAQGLPLTKAAIALAAGEPEAALEALQPALRFERANLQVPYWRGLSYLKLENGEAAVSEFQKIVDLPGLFPTWWLHSLARLGLARGHALAGATDLSRRSYQDFFALWEGADEDLPILREARAEYERLR